MLPLSLFANRNFAIGDLETLTLYGGLAGSPLLPGALPAAGRRLYAAAEQPGDASDDARDVCALARASVPSPTATARASSWAPGRCSPPSGSRSSCVFGVHVNYWRDVFPALVCFSVGLAMTVAPLTAAVLAGVEVRQAGIGSAVNNAIARVAGLLGDRRRSGRSSRVASRRRSTRTSPDTRSGRVRKRSSRARSASRSGCPTCTGSRPRAGRVITAAAENASLSSFHLGLGIAAVLVAAGGITAAIGITNPRRVVRAETCEGGQIVAAPLDAADCPQARVPEGAVAAT